MDIQSLIEQCHARLTYLSALRSESVRIGDSDGIITVDAEMATTQATLTQLESL
jgi:hypothetical protein